MSNTKVCKGRSDGKVRGCGRALSVFEFRGGRSVCVSCIKEAEKLERVARASALAPLKAARLESKEREEQERSELTGAPLCPRCRVRFRLSKGSYCKRCAREHMAERRSGEHKSGRLCEACDKHFEGRGENSLCPPCRLDYRQRFCVKCEELFWGSGGSLQCNNCLRDYARQWNQGYKRVKKVRDIRYRLSEGQFDEILEKQQGKCAMCKDILEFEVSHAVHMDHDHSCCDFRPTSTKPLCGNCFRGILCKHCNLLLGYAKDEISRLEAAITYLQSHSKDNADN
jgi:hypothetical protein